MGDGGIPILLENRNENEIPTYQTSTKGIIQLGQPASRYFEYDSLFTITNVISRPNLISYHTAE